MVQIETWFGETSRMADALAIREEVFVGEQGVPIAEEIDGKDGETFHVLALWDGEPVATARVFAGPVAKVGRVAVRRPWRGKSLGVAVMQAAETLAMQQGALAVGLDAQVSAIPFYERLGYVVDSPEFLDTGIPHRHMSKALMPAEGANQDTLP